MIRIKHLGHLLSIHATTFYLIQVCQTFLTPFSITTLRLNTHISWLNLPAQVILISIVHLLFSLYPRDRNITQFDSGRSLRKNNRINSRKPSSVNPSWDESGIERTKQPSPSLRTERREAISWFESCVENACF